MKAKSQEIMAYQTVAAPAELASNTGSLHSGLKNMAKRTLLSVTQVSRTGRANNWKNSV